MADLLQLILKQWKYSHLTTGVIFCVETSINTKTLSSMYTIYVALYKERNRKFNIRVYSNSNGLSFKISFKLISIMWQVSVKFIVILYSQTQLNIISFDHIT